MDLVSNAEGGMITAFCLCLHNDIGDLDEDVVGEHWSSEDTESELTGDYLDAGAGTKCPC